jgi:hypothetical protein
MDDERPTLRTLPADDPPPVGASPVYQHPLQALSDINGLYPIADLQDSPSGQRFAVEESVQFNEDGTVVHAGGVVEYPYTTITTAEREAIALTKTPWPSPPPPPERLGVSLIAAMETADPSTVLDLDIVVVTPQVEPAFVSIEKEIARGNVVTFADVEAKHLELLQEEQARIVTAQTAVSLDIRALGGIMMASCDNMPCLYARLEAGKVNELSEHPGIVTIGLASPVVEDAFIGGNLVGRGSQIRQYIDAGYDGENATNSDIRFAVIENASYHDEHLGFKDGSGTGTRILDRFNCSGVSCASTTNFAVPTDDHATYVAGILFGDLRDGQDPLYPNATDRVERSGHAPESLGLLYRNTPGTSTGLIKALDHVRGLATKPPVVNLSLSVEEDLACKGQTASSHAVNNLFQAGTLVFKSASNTGHASASDCTVGSPGAAIGAFTVGAHGDSWEGLETDVRTDVISTESARGGVSLAEGSFRSIIDLTAFGFRTFLYETPSGYNNASHGTSLSTPTVAAAAIDFIDMYKNFNNSNFIDSPGVLFANMLLMGDRKSATGKLLTGFDNLYGAGRLMMRMPTVAGMDAPALWKNSWVCVGHGQRVKVKINSGVALPATVNVLKAAIFWYDRRHGTGQQIDDVDLELFQIGSATPLAKSDSSYDNKERVFYTSPGGKSLELGILGYNVTATDEGCGSGMQRVYYAYFYEDSARRSDRRQHPGRIIAETHHAVPPRLTLARPRRLHAGGDRAPDAAAARHRRQRCAAVRGRRGLRARDLLPRDDLRPARTGPRLRRKGVRRCLRRRHRRCPLQRPLHLHAGQVRRGLPAESEVDRAAAAQRVSCSARALCLSRVALSRYPAERVISSRSTRTRTPS